MCVNGWQVTSVFLTSFLLKVRGHWTCVCFCTLQHRHREQNVECPLCYVKAVFVVALTHLATLFQRLLQNISHFSTYSNQRTLQASVRVFSMILKVFWERGNREANCMFFPSFLLVCRLNSKEYYSNITQAWAAILKKALICILSCDNGHLSHNHSDFAPRLWNEHS